MKKNQKGQALIELIIFLPIMFTLYSIIAGFANAINGSINQQKITRAYFYYKVQNNSTMPKPDGTTYKSWSTFGMFFIGWKDYFLGGAEGEVGPPVAPCYRITIPLSASAGDNCESKYTSPTTQFIRVQTVYGFCGATYGRDDQAVTPIPDRFNSPFSMLADETGCYITQ